MNSLAVMHRRIDNEEPVQAASDCFHCKAIIAITHFKKIYIYFFVLLNLNIFLEFLIVGILGGV